MTYVVARYSSVPYAPAVEQPSLGRNIRNARIAGGISSQSELARKLRVPQSQMSDWENDRYGALDMKTLLRIAAAIPCAIDDLVVGMDELYDISRRDLVRQSVDVDSGEKNQGESPPHATAAASSRVSVSNRRLLAELGEAAVVFRKLGTDAISWADRLRDLGLEYGLRPVPSKDAVHGEGTPRRARPRRTSSRSGSRR